MCGAAKLGRVEAEKLCCVMILQNEFAKFYTRFNVKLWSS